MIRKFGGGRFPYNPLTTRGPFSGAPDISTIVIKLWHQRACNFQVTEEKDDFFSVRCKFICFFWNMLATQNKSFSRMTAAKSLQSGSFHTDIFHNHKLLVVHALNRSTHRKTPRTVGGLRGSLFLRNQQVGCSSPKLIPAELEKGKLWKGTRRFLLIQVIIIFC